MESMSRVGNAITSRAWYGASFSEFIATASDAIIGKLTSNSEFDLILAQRDAWQDQIDFLRSSLNGLVGHLFLEFNIPRMGRRIDAVLLIDQIVFVIEFKIGEKTFEQSAFEQVWDYALDLKN